jgi:hypothetical protein
VMISVRRVLPGPVRIRLGRDPSRMCRSVTLTQAGADP